MAICLGEKMKRILLSLSFIFATSSTFAYDFQIDGAYTDFDNDASYIDSQQKGEIKGTYYFNPVETKNGPYNEAAFLGHSSNVYARYSYTDLQSKTYYEGQYIDTDDAVYDVYDKFETEVHSSGLGIEYFFEQFYLSGEVGFDQYKLNDQYHLVSVDTDDVYTYNDKYSSDATTYKAYVGYLPVENLLIAAGVEGYSSDDDNDAAFGIKAKYVTPIGQSNQYINLEAAGTFNDTTNLSIAGDFYFNKQFSVGTSYNFQDNGDTNTDYFTIRSKYFFNENFAVGAEAGFADDYNAYKISASVRF